MAKVVHPDGCRFGKFASYEMLVDDPEVEGRVVEDDGDVGVGSHEDAEIVGADEVMGLAVADGDQGQAGNAMIFYQLGFTVQREAALIDLTLLTAVATYHDLFVTKTKSRQLSLQTGSRSRFLSAAASRVSVAMVGKQSQQRRLVAAYLLAIRLTEQPRR
jgi:hypothetical protein